MGEFTGKVALITGGGAGIGRATALAFAREGASVVIGNRNAASGAETVALVRAAGGIASFKQTDVTRAADVEALVAHAVREFGALDCAFNNAGVFASVSPITAEPEDDFDRVLATNVKGVWLSLKYELTQMQKQGHGAIVNNASVAGLMGTGRGTASYTASKHAVLGLTKSAALENARRGIRVNAIAPGAVETDMSASFAKGLKLTPEELGRAHPIGRLGRPEEIAEAVLYLCSARTGFMLGHTLVVDGGFSVQ